MLSPFQLLKSPATSQEPRRDQHLRCTCILPTFLVNFYSRKAGLGHPGSFWPAFWALSLPLPCVITDCFSLLLEVAFIGAQCSGPCRYQPHESRQRSWDLALELCQMVPFLLKPKSILRFSNLSCYKWQKLHNSLAVNKPQEEGWQND